ISAYLWAVRDEASCRGYAFDASKIVLERRSLSLTVSRGQLTFEREHLKAKLRQRDPERYRALCRRPILAHPLFGVTVGPGGPWEKDGLGTTTRARKGLAKDRR